MFYNNVFRFILGLYKILGIKITVNGRENLPKDSYVIVSPHRHWIDPVVIATTVYPEQLTFMAKKELFKNKLFGWFIKKLNAFPVDRQNPGPSAIKIPVKKIKNNEQSLLIFPTGTRYSSDLKGGAFLIAKLAKSKIIPITYDAPSTFKEFVKRKKFTVNIGKPLDFDPKAKLDDEHLQSLEKQINDRFAMQKKTEEAEKVN